MLLSEVNSASGFFGLVPWIVFAPVIGLLINAFLGKRLGETGVGTVASLASGAAFLVSVLQAVSLAGHPEGAIVKLGEWIHIGSLALDWAFRVDTLSVTMMLVVSGVGTLIHIYAIGYMREDVRFKHDEARFTRFFVFLNLFIAAMMILVSADNYLMLFVGWEGVGLCSFLLIGFWYDMDTLGRPSWANSNAAQKAFITNRVGDFGFLIAGFLMFWYMGSFAFSEVFAAAPAVAQAQPWVITAITIFMLIGVVGKSAQIPLYVWLPDAMAGPTPVSALIHAATMVTAGVYLITRSAPIFSLLHDSQYIVATVGAVTALFAATIAVGQYDIKKVLAYSTISQLGYMVLGLGVGAYAAGFFHLVTHAMFKAGLFLGSGSVIHGMHHALHEQHDHHTDPQDIRNMGGLRKTMPITYITFLFATIAISGIPLTSGFLSKDGILAGTLAFANLSGHWLIPIFGFSAAFMTAFYMFRLTILAFHGEPKTEIAKHTHENNMLIRFPLILLAILSIWFFYSLNPIDGGSGWFAHSFKAVKTVVPADLQYNWLIPNKVEHHSTEHSNLDIGFETTELPKEHYYLNKFEEEIHHQHYNAMFLSLLVAGLGIGLAFFIYHYKKLDVDKITEKIKPLYNFSLKKWYFDEIYQATFINGTIGLSKAMFWFDSKIIDGIVNLSGWITKIMGFLIGLFDNIIIDGFVNLIAWIVNIFGAGVRKLQSGRVQTYILITAIFLIIFIWWIF